MSGESRRGELLVLTVIALGTFLDGLDGTIVNVALPSIAQSFGVGTGTSSWVITIYFLFMSGLILIFGKMADRGALKKVLTVGFVVFTLGSLLCALTPSFELLLVFRALQGAGASMLAASAVMLAVKFLPKERRGFGLALVIVGWSVGAAMGPALGAILTEFTSWHLIFLINVPIGAASTVLCIRGIPSDGEYDRSGFDLVGALVLFAALVMGMYALESMPSGVTTANTLCAVGFVVLFPLFVWMELRRPDPILDLRLFRIARFDLYMLALILINVCYSGAIYLAPFFMHVVLGMETLESGIYLLAPAIALLAVCPVVGKVSAKYGRWKFVLAGCVLMLVFSVLGVMFGPEMSMVLLAGNLAVLGLTYGFAGGPVGECMIGSLPDDRSGDGSNVLSFIVYFGTALGTALFAAVFGFASGSGGHSISDLPGDVFMQGFGPAMEFSVALSVVLILFVVAAMVMGRREKGSLE